MRNCLHVFQDDHVGSSVRATAAAAVCLGGLVISGCAEWGYTSRVLWRLPSPDRSVVAVCQEVPGFDGPGYDVRLESLDGSRLAQLYESADEGYPCDEVAWSPNGALVAVLSARPAVLIFIDIDWVLRHPTIPSSPRSWRRLGLSTGQQLQQARDLRFVSDSDVEVTTCPFSLQETRRTGTFTCTSPEVETRVTIARPVRIERADRELAADHGPWTGGGRRQEAEEEEGSSLSLSNSPGAVDLPEH